MYVHVRTSISATSKFGFEFGICRRTEKHAFTLVKRAYFTVHMQNVKANLDLYAYTCIFIFFSFTLS